MEYEKRMNTLTILADSSERLASGDFTTRTGLAPGKGELGRLIRSFDLMAQNLEDCEKERAHAYKALGESELRYRRLFEAAQDGIIILDAETGEIDDINASVVRMLGCSREQLLGKKLWEIVPFKNVEASKANFHEVPREAYSHFDDLSLQASDGRVVSIEFVSTTYLVNDRKLIQCNLRDIAKRKAAEKVRNEFGRRLQVLSRRLVQAQESERRHLALELHDEIGQALTVAELNLQRMLQLPSAKPLVPQLTESLGAVERVLEQVRDIALNLRPSMLDDLGLGAALQWFAKRQAASAGLKCELKLESFDRRLDPLIETECFRIAQEALTNIGRHAKARHVTIELQKDDSQIHLCVRDDGAGFDVASIREKATLGASLGLLSMEERASLVGGKLDIKSVPGHGTEVHAWFPLKWAGENDSAQSVKAPANSTNSHKHPIAA